MNADNALLTSSDYEQIVEDLKYDPNLEDYKLSPLPIDENNIPMQENELKQINHLQGQVDGQLQLLQNYETIQNLLQDTMGQNNTVPAQNVPILVSHAPTGAIPCRDQFPGPLNFQISWDSPGTGKPSWIFSMKLSKVFIDVFKSLLIKFHISHVVNGLYVRALPVYSGADFVSVPVQRCAVHEVYDDPMREAHSENQIQCFCHKFGFVRHVVRSSHPKACYAYDSESERHSVVVPLDSPQAGSNISEVEYHFSCKTSCPTGMNRKPIDVIFTLENEKCEVLGRCVLPVKICSCPKRDKEKEENAATLEGRNSTKSSGKRRISSTLDKSQPTKKLKTNNNSCWEVNETLDEDLLTSYIQLQFEDLSKIKKYITEVKEEQSKKFGIIEKKSEEMAMKMEKDITDVKEEQSKRFGIIENKSEEMAMKMENIEIKMENIDKNQKEMAMNMEKDITDVKEEQSKRFGIIENKSEEMAMKMEKDITNVKEEQSKRFGIIENKSEEMAMKMENIEIKMENIEIKMENIEKNQKEMAMYMERLEKLVIGLYPNPNHNFF